MRLAQDGKIVLDLVEVVGTNHTSVITDELHVQFQAIQFGSLSRACHGASSANHSKRRDAAY